MRYDSTVALFPSPSPLARARWSDADFTRDGTVVEPLAASLGADGAVLSFHGRSDASPLILNLLGSAVHDDPRATLALDHATALVKNGASRHDQAVEGGWLQHLGAVEGSVLSIRFEGGGAGGEIVFTALLPAGVVPDLSALAGAMRRIVPMLHLYFDLWQRHRQEVCRSRGIAGALDSMDFGVILVDRNGDLGFVNETAGALLDDGTFLRRRGRTLSAERLVDTMKIQAALAAAISSNLERERGAPQADFREAALLQLVYKGERRILATVPTERPAHDNDAVAAMLLILDPSANPARFIAPVCRLYGLSSVETQLACQLVAGRSLQEASETMRIKEQTARSYLKQVFQKTDVKRQSDLIRLLLSSLVRTRGGLNLLTI